MIANQHNVTISIGVMARSTTRCAWREEKRERSRQKKNRNLPDRASPADRLEQPGIAEIGERRGGKRGQQETREEQRVTHEAFVRPKEPAMRNCANARVIGH